MSEPTNINLVRSNISTNFLTASAFQDVNTPITSGYFLRWSAPLNSTTGYTLSVAYFQGGTVNASTCSIFIPYTTTSLFSAISLTEYFPINVSEALTINITSLTNDLTIDQNTNTLTQSATAVRVQFPLILMIQLTMPLQILK